MRIKLRNLGKAIRQRSTRGRAMKRPRRLRFEPLETRLLLASDWYNDYTPRDTNGDRVVSPVDALVGINELNEPTILLASGRLPERANHPHAPRYDANADGFLSPLDVLLVINGLRDDRSPPAIVVELEHDSAPGGTSNDDHVTFSGRLTGRITDDLTGIGRFVFMVAGGTAGAVEFDDEGNFSFEPPSLAEGENTVTFSAVDGRDNRSPLVSVHFTLDTLRPAITTNMSKVERSEVTTIELVFNEDVAASAFDKANYLLTRMSGENAPTDMPIVGMNQMDARTAQLILPQALPNDSYRLTILPAVADLAGNTPVTREFNFTVERPTRLSESSPGHGEEMVRLTRETIIRFDGPVDPATITADSFHLISNSERIPGHIRVSTTERFATFFYDEPLPPSTLIEIMVDGDMIMGRDGLPLDADNDGEPGGLLRADFRTLPLTLIPGTEVWGYVYDSHNKAPVEMSPIAVPAGDPHLDPMGTGSQAIPFRRAEFFPGTGTDASSPRLHPNKVSSFMDASMVYGSDSVRARALRSLDGSGKLKTSEGELLPVNNASTFPDGVLHNDNAGPTPNDQLFVAGDVRASENPLLASLHTLFVREHNRRADELKAAHPNWSDESLYQESRRWVAALIQHISYQEFLPAMVGEHPLPPYSGYRSEIDPGISTLFSTAAFRVGHTLQSNDIARLDSDGNSLPGGAFTLRDVFFNPNPLKADGIDPYLRGMIATPAQAVDLKVLDDLRNFLFGPPGAGGMDLAAINIQRGRDMGLPGYNQARRDMGLTAVTSFDQITSDANVAAGLQSVYGDVDAIDLWVGGLAEDYVPGGTVGPLFAAIMVDQFQRSRDGDRFWYENGQFSDADLAALRSSTLADVLQRNSEVANLPASVFTAGNINAGPDAGGSAGTPNEARTFDGYGNNPNNPRQGRAGEPLLVNFTIGYANGVSEPAAGPNPREISNALFQQTESDINVLGVTQMFVTWGQFLDHDLSLTPSQSLAGTDIPVINATIELEALPQIKAATDKLGFFSLTSPEGLPAPEFFVRIDGSTAINAPDGTVYATLGKPFHGIPGQRTQLEMSGVPFNVYLPPVSMGDIASLNPDSDTIVGFGPAAQEQIRAMFADDLDQAQLIIDTMRVTFPAGSAQDESGSPATRAALTPFDPRRMPLPLPPTANPQLVVLIHAATESGNAGVDESINFDVPAPISFPNLRGLAPGQQTSIFAFDHDAGEWLAVGTATVSDDGLFISSDPGQGIIAPGWHFLQ